jgi:hypothetical protein
MFCTLILCLENLLNFHFFHFFIIIVMRVHCDIYKSSCIIVELTSYIILFYPPSPSLLNFQIYIIYIIYNLYYLSYLFTDYFGFSKYIVIYLWIIIVLAFVQDKEERIWKA